MTRRTLYIFVTAVAANHVLQLGCAAPGGVSPELIAVPGYRLGAEGAQWPDARPIRLAGALGETLGLHVAICAGGGTLPAPNLRVRDFDSAEGSIAASAAELFRIHPVGVARWPGWHIRSVPISKRDPAPLDVLVPLDAPRGGLPRFLDPGEVYHFWVDIRIPQGVTPGEYRSQIVLTSSEQDVTARDIELVVWPIVLPLDTGFETIAELDPAALVGHHRPDAAWPNASGGQWSVESRAILLATARQMRRQRVSAVFPTLAPTARIDGSAKLSLDWEFFDSVVGGLLSGHAFADRRRTMHWPVPNHPSLPLSAGDVPSHRRLVSEYLSGVLEHFQEKGWSDRLYLLTRDLQTTRSPNGRNVAENLVPFPSDVALVSTEAAMDGKTRGRHGYIEDKRKDLIDQWAPPARLIDRRVVAREAHNGRPTWFCADHPPYSGSIELTSPPASPRVLPWQAASLHAPVLFLGPVTRWPEAHAAHSPAACTALDPANLLYPGTTFGLVEPVMSLRLKRLRRGLEDVAYLRLLREHGRSAIADHVISGIVHHVGTGAYDAHYAAARGSGWPDDPGVFETARQLMAEEMLRVAADRGDEADREGFARTASWRRFHQMTRQPTISAEGVRIRVAGTPARPLANVSAHLVINGLDRGAKGGAVRLEHWPARWDPPPISASFRGPNTDGPLRMYLEALAPLDAVLETGAVDLPGIAQFDNGRRATTSIPVRVTSALRCAESPHIDGDLSDWPVATVNVATDFLSIAQVAPDEDLSSRLTAGATTVVLMRNDRDLFIAINAATGRPEAPAPRSRKSVTYEDAIPVGEELVELLFDPLNLAARSPEGVYHVVVKRSGADLTERGVALSPPVGERQAWAADIDVAVSARRDRWTAEVRIPLESFGIGPFRNVFWGFNVTRFDAWRSEYSTWAGSARNAYNPIGFGNLFLPP